MQELELFRINALYRDDFRIMGYSFGEGEETVCVMGSMRGNEYQQIYVCSLLIKKLKMLEEEGRITEGKKILVIPCGNPYSVNVKKRFCIVIECYRIINRLQYYKKIAIFATKLVEKLLS